LRLRTRPPRRKRRRPLLGAPAAANPASSEPAAETSADGAASAAGAPAGDPAAAAPAAPRLGPDGQPLRRRRRRRRPPQFAAAAEGAAAQAGGEGAPSAPRDPNRPPRRRPPRRRPQAASADGAPQQTGAEAERPPRDRPGSSRFPRQARGEGTRGDGPRGRPGERRRDTRGRDDRRNGRGGRDAPKKTERKLYSFDSVVDRGFEDVEEEGGDTRRVHWTIVKRTVADQISRKPMSQSYVLQREGVDSEFPTLGAARDTVNKTIVHPEKLTLSKAEHVAQKGNSR
jgi:hypothetical protein